MKKLRIKFLLFSILTFFLFASASACADDQIEKIINQKDIVMKTQFNTADFAGSYVIIAFVSHYCRDCIHTIISLNKLNDRYKGSEVKVAVIYADKIIDENEIRAFAAKENIHFPLYIGNQQMVNKYTITFIPTILFLDTAGSMIGKHIGHKKEKELEEKFFQNHTDSQ